MHLMQTEMEEKVTAILARGEGGGVPTADATVYLDLAESVVRQMARHQAPAGLIGDPYHPAGVETPTTTGRYTAAVAHLLRAGRCLDLLESGARALDWCCAKIAEHHRQGTQLLGAGFYLKDMLVLYEVLQGRVDAGRWARWSEQLSAPTPEALYDGERNWHFYNAAAETLRVKHGLSARRDAIDALVAGQMPWWTAHGLYRDPNEPTTYDLTVRQALAFMLENGYDGEYVDWMRQVLRTGALTTLLFVSPNGVAPFGGRSNQFHHMEAMIAYFCEWQAREEARAGNLALAGALRRVALAGAETDRRWLLQDPYFSLKNQVREPLAFGHDPNHPGLSLHGAYGLLAANLFGGTYHVADPTIPAAPAPSDIGGYLLYLSDAFYRLWATAGSYHIQLDTRAQPGYDATGLGRLHRRGLPIDVGLNMGIAARPTYTLPVAAAPRSVALGVGWPANGGWRYLSEANRETHDVAVQTHAEGASVAFTVCYESRGDGLNGVARVQEEYLLSEEGLRVRVTVPGAARLRLQVPVIETDGRHRAEIHLGADSVAARYLGHTFRVHLPGGARAASFEPWQAPNRNGFYRVALFEVDGPTVAYTAVLE